MGLRHRPGRRTLLGQAPCHGAECARWGTRGLCGPPCTGPGRSLCPLWLARWPLTEGQCQSGHGYSGSSLMLSPVVATRPPEPLPAPHLCLTHSSTWHRSPQSSPTLHLPYPTHKPVSTLLGKAPLCLLLSTLVTEHCPCACPIPQMLRNLEGKDLTRPGPL